MNDDATISRPVTTRVHEPASTRRWTTLLTVALVVVTLIPVVIAAARVIGITWYSAGDQGMLELRTHDVGGSLTPLVGPYSRYGWNHPGPMLFWLLGIGYHVTGQASWALLFGSAVINIVAIAALLGVARQRGIAALAIVGAGTAVLVHALGQQFLVDPWNPWITTLPFACLIVLTWTAARGSAGSLIASAVVGSFLVQSHIAFAFMVSTLWMIAAVGFVWTRRVWRSVVIALFVVALCWTPVVIDQFFGGGNLTLLVTFFTSSHDTIGFSRALGIATRELVGYAPWMGGVEPIAADGSIAGRSLALLVVPVVAYVAVGLLAWRRRASDAVLLQCIVGLTVVVGVASLARTNDAAVQWLVRWWWPLAMLWWASLAFSLVRIVESLPMRAASSVAVASFSVVCLWASVVTAAAPRPEPVDADFQPVLAAIVPGTLAAVPPGTVVYLRAVGPESGWMFDGMAARLERHGVHVKVDDSERFKLGRQRVWKGQRPITSVLITTSQWDARCAARPGVQSVATWDVHDPHYKIAAGRVTVLFTSTPDAAMCFRQTY